MSYEVRLEERAVQDIRELKKSGNRIAVTKIGKLLEELRVHPTYGTGQVEALKGNLSGLWSRRIDRFNRLIYAIEENIVTVTVISAKGHYDR